MSEQKERLPALGQPVEDPTPDGDHDFAGEHDATVVDRGVLDGSSGEDESPDGWSGLEREGPS